MATWPWSCLGSGFVVACPRPHGRQVFGLLGRLLRYANRRWRWEWALALELEEGRVRSGANLILAITVAFVLQAGLCPALCFARGAEPASVQPENAGAPENMPCHDKSNAPSRGETREDCDRDCSRVDSVVFALSGTRTVLDAPAASLTVTIFSLIPLANAAPVGEFELAPAPPPRNLLLVKNSFLI